MNLKFYIDEDVAKQTVQFLQNDGFQAVYARDLSHMWPDYKHLVYAAENGYAILTANKNDFRMLHHLWILLEQKKYLTLSHLGILTAKTQLRPQSWLMFVKLLVSSGENISNGCYVWDNDTQMWEKERPIN
jgi:predicted nuclease of predicted toxin-antitoxin system